MSNQDYLSLYLSEAKRHDIHESESNIAQALSSSSQTLPVSVVSGGAAADHSSPVDGQIEKNGRKPPNPSHSSSASSHSGSSSGSNKLTSGGNSSTDDDSSSLTLAIDAIDVNLISTTTTTTTSTTAGTGHSSNTASTTTTSYIEFEGDFDNQTSLARLLDINGTGQQSSSSLSNLECVIDSVAAIDELNLQATVGLVDSSLSSSSSTSVPPPQPAPSSSAMFNPDVKDTSFKLVDKLKSKINESKKKELMMDSNGSCGSSMSSSSSSSNANLNHLFDESESNKSTAAIIKKEKKQSKSTSSSSSSTSSSPVGKNNKESKFSMSGEDSSNNNMMMMPMSAASISGQHHQHLDTSISLDNFNDFDDLILGKPDSVSASKQPGAAAKPKPNTSKSKQLLPWQRISSQSISN